jgi:plastocyanin
MRGATRRGRAIAAIAAVAAAGLGAAHAFGASETIASSAACCTFTQPSYTIDAGAIAQFSNVAASSDHNVFASGNGPDGRRLFSSPTLKGGQAGSVNGSQYLSPGTYHFLCTIHEGMEGDLVVSANGTPVARPSVKLKVLSKKIGKVAASGGLAVKVTARTQSDDVTLTASKGAKKLGSKKNLDLAAGSSKTVKLPLTGSGRHALANLGSAKVKVSADVPFGAPASASRKLG